MAIVSESHPQSWSFAPEQGLKRDWVPEVAKKDKLEFAVSKSDAYDFTTVFYEVSYCSERGFFYALGPKFLNFEDLVLPMKARFSCDNRKSYSDLECRTQPNWLGFGNSNITMNAPDLPFGTIHLELELANGNKKEFEIFNRKQPHTRIVVSTMQKDNNVRWIIDWLNYYRSLGVFDFRIYDNNSQNILELIEAIKETVPDDVKVQIVHWPYRYGIAFFVSSLFSQRASILDGLYQSGAVDWLINCDIDEYFIVDQKDEGILGFLDSFDLDVGCVQFSCSDAFLMKDKTYENDLTIRDIDWRKKEIKTKFKNACRPKCTRTAGVHYVKLTNGFREVSPPDQKAIYLHALPLTTGWNSSARSRAWASTSNESFVEDRRVVEQMEKVDKSAFGSKM